MHEKLMTMKLTLYIKISTELSKNPGHNPGQSFDP